MSDSMPAEATDARTSTGARRIVRRIVVLAVGVPVALLGLILLVVPGPGTPLLIAGLAILAIEFPWAQNHIDRLKRAARRVLRRPEEPPQG